MARPRKSLEREAVPYLHEKVIEAEAQLLLQEYSIHKNWKIAAPIPIDDIIEIYLKLEFGIEDLQALLTVPGVLGAIWFDEKRVSVDVRLDPSSNPRQLGRYRFTLGHEAGHWRLHRKHFRETPEQIKLFDGRGQPAFICRSSSKPHEEIQADMFSGFLLMPREVVRSEWQAWRGSLDAIMLHQVTSVTVGVDSKENRNASFEQYCRPLAERFEVSAEAMRIRLESLEFLLDDQQMLF